MPENVPSLYGEIVKIGCLKKLKTMKKKLFVIRADGPHAPACLQYYDKTKHFKRNRPPKRMIPLIDCFNISRRTDTKQKYVIGLFLVKIECFSIVLNNEYELNEWLKTLLAQQQGLDLSGSVKPIPRYECMWKVVVQDRDLMTEIICGPCYLGLSDHSVSLIVPSENKCYEFSFQVIRRCGCYDSYFYLELGQASIFGSGNVWMELDDSAACLNVHDVVMKACNNAPKLRARAASATEPYYPHRRRLTLSGDNTCVGKILHGRSQSHYEPSLVISSPVTSNHSIRSMVDGIPSFCSLHAPIRRASTGNRPFPVSTNIHHPAHLSYVSAQRTNPFYSVRERADSMPAGHSALESRTAPRATSSALVSRPNSCYPLSSPGTLNVNGPRSVGHGSSESAGSSLSVDGDAGNWSESEHCRHHMCSSVIDDNLTIQEENADEYIEWGIDTNNRSENPCTCQKLEYHTNSTRCSYSPCSSSPVTESIYLPVGEEGPDAVKKRLNHCSFDSVNHSRGSSIHEELASDGYMHMAARSTDTGYTSCRHMGDMSPGLSSSSVTSGTTSIGHRFSECHLNRVMPYLHPEEDTNFRPIRSYSAGSKSESFCSKHSRSEKKDDHLRTRAFSVGSHNNKPCVNLLPKLPTPSSLSASSFEPYEDDLMEMDFSANKNRKKRAGSSYVQPRRHSAHGGYCCPGSLSNYTTSSSNNTDRSFDKSSPRFSHLYPSLDSGIARVKHMFGRSPPKTSNFPLRDLKPPHSVSNKNCSTVLPSGTGLERVLEKSPSPNSGVAAASSTVHHPSVSKTLRSNNQPSISNKSPINSTSVDGFQPYSTTTGSQFSTNEDISCYVDMTSPISITESIKSKELLKSIEDTSAYVEMTSPISLTEESTKSYKEMLKPIKSAVKSSSPVNNNKDGAKITKEPEKIFVPKIVKCPNSNSVSEVPEGYIDMNFKKSRPSASEQINNNRSEPNNNINRLEQNNNNRSEQNNNNNRSQHNNNNIRSEQINNNRSEHNNNNRSEQNNSNRSEHNNNQSEQNNNNRSEQNNRFATLAEIKNNNITSNQSIVNTRRHSSNPVSMQHTNRNRPPPLLSSDPIRKKSVDESAPKSKSSTMSILPLGIPISTSFWSLGRRRKKTESKKENPKLFSPSGSESLDTDQCSSIDCNDTISMNSYDSTVVNDIDSIHIDTPYSDYIPDDLLNGTMLPSKSYIDAVHKILFDGEDDRTSMISNTNVISKLKRKISAPSSGFRYNIPSKSKNQQLLLLKQNEQKSNLNKNRKLSLIRSTSVPTDMSAKQGSTKTEQASKLEFEKNVDSSREHIYTDWSLNPTTTTNNEEENPYAEWPGPTEHSTPKNGQTKNNVANSSVVSKTLESKKSVKGGTVTYASLDLPADSAESNGNSNQSDNKLIVRGSNKINTYAKIDFDKSTVVKN